MAIAYRLNVHGHLERRVESAPDLGSQRLVAERHFARPRIDEWMKAGNHLVGAIERKLSAQTFEYVFHDKRQIGGGASILAADREAADVVVVDRPDDEHAVRAVELIEAVVGALG